MSKPFPNPTRKPPEPKPVFFYAQAGRRKPTLTKPEAALRGNHPRQHRYYVLMKLCKIYSTLGILRRSVRYATCDFWLPMLAA
jgi:hypothetical protein